MSDDRYQSDADSQGMTSSAPDAMAGGYITNMPDTNGRGLTAAPGGAFIRSQQFPNDRNMNAGGQYDPILDGRWTNDDDGDAYQDVAETFEDN